MRQWKQAILRRRRWTGGPLAGAEFGAVSLVWDVGVGLGAGRRDRQRCGDGCEGRFHIRCNPRRRRQVIRSGDDALTAPSPARPYRPSRVRRVRTHGGGPLPAGTGARHAACRRRLGAWLASLADRSASCWAGDPCAGTGNRPAVPAGGDVAGLSGSRAQDSVFEMAGFASGSEPSRNQEGRTLRPAPASLVCSDGRRIRNPCRPCRPSRRHPPSQVPSSPASPRPSPRWSPAGRRPRPHPAAPSEPPWSGQQCRPSPSP